MKKFIVSLVVVIVGLVPASALAANTSSPQAGLKIAEVYMGSSSSGSDEYVVVTNTSGKSMNVGGISLDYKSATGKTWSTRAEVTGSREIGSYADLTFAVSRPHDYELKSGMAQAAGNIRLQAADGSVVDQLAWGNGDSSEGHAAPAPKAGEALARICDDAAKTCQDTDDNVADFQIINVDMPAGKGDTSSPGTGEVVPGDESADLEITELFPDPTSPQTDSKDEFVEIYNGGATAANLSGWKLVDAGGHVSKLTGTIAAGSYMALYAPQTKLSLNNGGDTVSLVGPSGVTVMTTPNYGKAKAGKAFGATTAGWGWLTTPTPGGANSALSVDQSTESTTTTTKKVTASKSTKKAAGSKVKTKSPALAKAASANSKDGAASIGDALSSSLPWPWLLAGLAAIAVGYGVYEYRPEILSYYAKLRAKLGAGK